MKQYLTQEQIKELSSAAQKRLAEWYANFMVMGDDLARVYIPEEKDGESSGEFVGLWDSEHEFNYPKYRVDSLNNHSGTILPLLDIGQMMQIMIEHNLHSNILVDDGICDYLWRLVKPLLEQE